MLIVLAVAVVLTVAFVAIPVILAVVAVVTNGNRKPDLSPNIQRL